MSAETQMGAVSIASPNDSPFGEEQVRWSAVSR
jgi:hypothetical protein